MNKLVIGFISLIVISFLLPGFFSGADLLAYLPSYSFNGFERPKNSLLTDPVMQFEPWRHYAKNILLAGEIPFWNHLNGLGSPFLANPQTALFFPLTMLYYVFPLPGSLYLIHLLKIFFMFFFTFLYLHTIVRSNAAKVMGAGIAATCAFFIMWLQWPKTNVFLFFPLILFITEKIYQSKDNYRWFIFLSLAYFFAITGGHPETLFHIFILHIAYLLWRLWGNKKKIFQSLISVLMGFLLGSFLLFPFIEYLQNSFVLISRSEQPLRMFLPKISFLFHLIPFLFGAPHERFYRPLAENTNFQETAGGYVGPVVFLTAILGAIYYRRVHFVRFWIGIVIFIWLFVYNIWPFGLIQDLPVFNISMNTRLIGFASFGLTILFTIVMDNVIYRGDNFLLRRIQKNLITYFSLGAVFTVFLLFAVLWMPLFFDLPSSINPEFVLFLQQHIILLVLSSALFSFSIILFIRKKNRVFFWIFIVSLFVQTVALFWHYNPVISKRKFYPKTEIIEKILSLPEGPVLEVGNMNFPENINLIYGIKHVQNYDALGIASYRRAFDKAFPVKNRWGRVEEADISQLQKFGIKYVISDYDIRLKKKIIQPAQDDVAITLSRSKHADITFRALPKSKALRLMFATHNRNNTCTITVDIKKLHSSSFVQKTKIPCQKISNFMYFTIPFEEELVGNEEYTVILNATNEDDKNAVSLVGKGNDPYLEILYLAESEKKQQAVKLLWQKNNIYLWEVPQSQLMTSEASYRVLISKPEFLLFEMNSPKRQIVEAKIPYYPGWEVFIDGKQTPILQSDPFISFALPQGRHAVQLSFTPYSFYVGLIISLMTFLCIFLYVLRKERKKEWYSHFLSAWDKKAERIRRRSNLGIYVALFFFSFVAAVSAFVTLITFVPLPSGIPETTAVNWFTVHNYPIQRDYLLFFLGVPFIFLLTLFLWVLILWKRS